MGVCRGLRQLSRTNVIIIIWTLLAGPLGQSLSVCLDAMVLCSAEEISSSPVQKNYVNI